MAAKHTNELNLFGTASGKLIDAQKLLAEASAKIAVAQNLMAEAGTLLKQDLDNAVQEKAAIEEITKTLNQVHITSTIKLNIGGKMYQTSLDTLRKDPHSMLCAMFSGRFELKAEKDGTYFIDRDGKLFRYILNYLRNGKLLLPNDGMIQKELLEEAMFYQIQGIIVELQEKTQFEASLILKDEKHRSALMSWLPPNASCSLLYQTSADGKTPADFHRCCDNKDPTLVVVRSDQYIFGGYTSRSWESVTKFKLDSQSFLFALVSPSGNEPIKMLPIPGAGILCRTEYGPCFGINGCFDLQLLFATDINDGRDYQRVSFRRPPSDQEYYFTGKSYFVIRELEAFTVNFSNHF